LALADGRLGRWPDPLLPWYSFFMTPGPRGSWIWLPSPLLLSPAVSLFSLALTLLVSLRASTL
jgi:hypothetical protein